jgi:hypothetical protein
MSMTEFPVIFSLGAVGSLVRMSVGLTLKLVAPKPQSGTVAMSPERPWCATAALPVDPIVRFGFILACDGAIVLALVSALPGAQGLERTCLAFALLCVGGLIGEISSTGLTTNAPNMDADESPAAPRRPVSRRLALALTLMLNGAVAALAGSQDLIDIVPPRTAIAGTQELDPVIVVARRPFDPLDERAASY